MAAAEIQAKISKNCDPRAYTPKAGQAPATVLWNTNYFGIFRKMAKTYHEDQMIERIFSPHQPTISNLADTMVSFVSTSLWDSFEQMEPQPSVTRYRHSRHVQYISLPQYATEISSRPGQSVFYHKSPAEATVQDPQSCSVCPRHGSQHKPSGHLL